MSGESECQLYCKTPVVAHESRCSPPMSSSQSGAGQEGQGSLQSSKSKVQLRGSAVAVSAARVTTCHAFAAFRTAALKRVRRCTLPLTTICVRRRDVKARQRRCRIARNCSINDTRSKSASLVKVSCTDFSFRTCTRDLRSFSAFSLRL